MRCAVASLTIGTSVTLFARLNPVERTIVIRGDRRVPNTKIVGWPMGPWTGARACRRPRAHGHGGTLNEGPVGPMPIVASASGEVPAVAQSDYF